MRIPGRTPARELDILVDDAATDRDSVLDRLSRRHVARRTWAHGLSRAAPPGPSPT